MSLHFDKQGNQILNIVPKPFQSSIVTQDIDDVDGGQRLGKLLWERKETKGGKKQWE